MTTAGFDFSSIVSTELVRLCATILVIWIVLSTFYVMVKNRTAFSKMLTYGKRLKASDHFEAVFEVLYSSLIQHNLFSKPHSKGRGLTHLLIFWGFVGLAVATILSYITHPSGGPLPLTHVVRIVGNAAGALLIIGVTAAVVKKLVDPDLRAATSLAEGAFLALLWVTGVTGFLADLAGICDHEAIAPIYLTHLLSAAALIALAPFTQFIHCLGRPLLILYEAWEKRSLAKGV